MERSLSARAQWQQREEHHAAAMRMNDVACELQRRCCDQEALQTFHEALHLMKRISTAPALSPSDDDEVERLVRRAYGRLSLATTASMGHPVMFFRIVDDSSSSVDLAAAMAQLALQREGSSGHNTTNATTSDNNTENTPPATSVGTTAANCCFYQATLIRMAGVEDDDVPAGSTGRDVELDCAILLHNAAVSTFCLSLYASPSDPTSYEMAEKSTKLLDLSRAVLYKKSLALRADVVPEHRSILRKLSFVALTASISLAMTLSASSSLSNGSNGGAEDDDDRYRKIKLKSCLQDIDKLSVVVADSCRGLPSSTGRRPAPAA